MRSRQEMERTVHIGAPQESFGELIGELAGQSASLVRDELQLARQELREKFSTLQSALIVMATGAVIALLALLAFLAAVILALALVMEAWLAALLTGVVLAVAAGIIIFIAIGQLRQTSLRPEQTMETLEENKEWLKEIT